MLLTVLADSYWEDEENNRIVMKLHPRLAPIKAVICPLTKKRWPSRESSSNYEYA